jgi:hypothetical protein
MARLPVRVRRSTLPFCAEEACCAILTATMGATEWRRLVGREVELRRLDAFLDDAASGSNVLLLAGEAGIGKTTLLQAGVDRARMRGFSVVEARPTEAEGRRFDSCLSSRRRTSSLSGRLRTSTSLTLDSAGCVRAPTSARRCGRRWPVFPERSSQQLDLVTFEPHVTARPHAR